MSRAARRVVPFDFAGPLPAVWDALADTARYNEAAALPRQTIAATPGGDGGLRFTGKAWIGPVPLAWEELPCNWVRERWFEHERRFERGPLRTFTVRFALTPRGSGCHADYRMEAVPRGLGGRLLLAGGFLGAAGRMFEKLAAQADRFALGARSTPFRAPPAALPAGAGARLDALARQLDAGPYGHGLAGRLAAEIREGAEVDNERLRPLALARRWGVPGLHAIEACLEATRLGLLDLRWDLLCPRCRGAKVAATSLDRLPAGAHCESCNIDYERDFSRNVEATFRPAAAIRPLGEGAFCLFAPMSTPHVLAQVGLDPGEARTIAFAAPAGPYRLRTLEAGPEALVEHGGGGEGFPSVTVTGEAIVAGAAGEPETVALVNAAGHRRTVVIEDRRWTRDALTADRLTTLQAFRDLFSDAVLRPGDEVGIRRVTLLFSDLQGSTALYLAAGDAAAYRLVREHFAYLGAIVREHEGGIVKTIGDAVMAAFHDPAQAMRAALAMQGRISAFNARNAVPVTLKLALHEGPCIAVTLNDRLDYFGHAVNLAARLQGESRGGDIVLSQALASRLAEAMELPGQGSTESVRLRGIAEPVTFVRLAFGPAAPERPRAGPERPALAAGPL